MRDSQKVLDQIADELVKRKLVRLDSGGGCHGEEFTKMLVVLETLVGLDLLCEHEHTPEGGGSQALYEVNHHIEIRRLD